MHFEILVEDKSGKIILDKIMGKIIPHNSGDTYRVIPYRGAGHIPKNLNANEDPQKRHLLNQLPRLLQGYGKSFQAFRDGVRQLASCRQDTAPPLPKQEFSRPQ